MRSAPQIVQASVTHTLAIGVVTRFTEHYPRGAPVNKETQPALLVLEDGTTWKGLAWGALGETTGEIVFSTGMTGYQETLTDPSYHRQIVMMTAPHIGNTGINEEDSESDRIWVAGFVARDPARRPSNWRTTGTLDDALRDANIVGISGVDTRAITRQIRTHGSMKAGIFSGTALPETLSENTVEALVEHVRSRPSIHHDDLAHQVTVSEPYMVEPRESFNRPLATVVALDLGIKSMTPQRLAERGLRVHVLPATSTIDDLLSYQPDGVFFSNGPGDPQRAESEVELLRQVLDKGLPYFGICFGNQILGRALGFDTYKLTFGHRGINQPVKDISTGKVEITSQNHGFAVLAEPGVILTSPYANGKYGRVQVSHVGLNDQVVEGLACLDIPAFSVQYHPEAAAGPHDASYLFDRFVAAILAHKENTDA